MLQINPHIFPVNHARVFWAENSSSFHPSPHLSHQDKYFASLDLHVIVFFLDETFSIKLH